MMVYTNTVIYGECLFILFIFFFVFLGLRIMLYHFDFRVAEVSHFRATYLSN